MKARIQWATPDIDKQIMFMARVSNPANQDSNNSRLLFYCMEHGHVSPFDMANVAMEIDTTRDIGRQILRHSSFKFQEFSQRYENVEKLGDWERRECRIQDFSNRQNSMPCIDEQTDELWANLQSMVASTAIDAYRAALSEGIAKEQARALLPEGLTPSRLYMNGTMRSWIFYLKQRLDLTTQKEHRQVAEAVLEQLRTVAPITMAAFFGDTE